MEISLDKINRFSRRPLKEEEIYCFSVILCDNDIDRDCEKFTVPALKKLAELYVGKTGIFNHDPKGQNQTARIYDTEVISDPSRKTGDGEVYTYLKASAYMVRTSSNADLIKEIDAGIKKEVSVGCSVSRRICSVCGREISKSRCAHEKGKTYNGRRCFTLLDEPKDAYEWSFVAVPAQKNAGVTKHFTTGAEEKTSRAVGVFEQLTEDLKKDILRLSFLEGDSVPVELTKAAIQKMTPEELLKMKQALKNRVTPVQPELSTQLEKNLREHTEAQNMSFRV